MPNVKTLFWNGLWTYVAISTLASVWRLFRELGHNIVEHRKNN